MASDVIPLISVALGAILGFVPAYFLELKRERNRLTTRWDEPLYKTCSEFAAAARKSVAALTACWGAWSSTTVLAPAASPSSSCSYPLLHSHPATTRRRPREITALDREPIGSLRRLRRAWRRAAQRPSYQRVLLAVVPAGATPGTRASSAIRQRAR